MMADPASMGEVIDLTLKSHAEHVRVSVGKFIRNNGVIQKGPDVCRYCMKLGSVCVKLMEGQHCMECFVAGVVCQVQSHEPLAAAAQSVTTSSATASPRHLTNHFLALNAQDFAVSEQLVEAAQRIKSKAGKDVPTRFPAVKAVTAHSRHAQTETHSTNNASQADGENIVDEVKKCSPQIKRMSATLAHAEISQDKKSSSRLSRANRGMASMQIAEEISCTFDSVENHPCAHKLCPGMETAQTPEPMKREFVKSDETIRPMFDDADSSAEVTVESETEAHLRSLLSQLLEEHLAAIKKFKCYRAKNRALKALCKQYKATETQHEQDLQENSSKIVELELRCRTLNEQAIAWEITSSLYKKDLDVATAQIAKRKRHPNTGTSSGKQVKLARKT